MAEQNDLPELHILESRFDFVDNPTLRSNLAISFQYIIFLIKVEEERNTTGAIEYSIFKNIIQYTAAIVEGLMNYGLEKAIKSGHVTLEKVMPREKKYKDIKELYSIDTSEKIIGATLKLVPEKFGKRTQFKTICDAYKKGNLIPSRLLANVNELREQRNKIHLAGLTQVENYYNKTDIDQAFATAAEVTSAIEGMT